jgi:hypothetical protein
MRNRKIVDFAPVRCSISTVALTAALAACISSASAQPATGTAELTAEDVARFAVGDYELKAYAGIGYLGGAKYGVSGFAYEPFPGQLVNPLDELRINAEGRVFFGGVDFGNRPEIKDYVNQFGFLKEGITYEQVRQRFIGVSLEVEQISIEGRSRFAGMGLPNLGVPGVGDQFGFFVNSPVDSYSTNAFVHHEQTGIKLEGRIGQFFAIKDPFIGDRAIGISVAALAGVHLSDRHTKIGHSLDAYFPAFGINGDLTANYRTSVDELSVTPYFGVAMDKDMALENGAVFRSGVAARAGFSFTNWDIQDRLSADGLGGLVARNNSNEFSGTDTNVYGSVTGYMGIEWGEGWAASVGAGVQSGLVRSPNLFRPDSIEVSPGVFQLADPVPDFQALTTYSVSFKLGRKF